MAPYAGKAMIADDVIRYSEAAMAHFDSACPQGAP